MQTDSHTPAEIAIQGKRVLFLAGLTLVCLDLQTGHRLWDLRINKGLFDSNPELWSLLNRINLGSSMSVSDDLAIVSALCVTEHADLEAISMLNGASIWTWSNRLGAGSIWSQALWNNQVIVLSRNRLLSLNISSGEVLWSQTLGDLEINAFYFGYCGIAVSAAGLIFGSTDDQIWCVSAIDGSRVWRRTRAVAGSVNGIAIDHDRVFVTGDFGIFSVTLDGRTVEYIHLADRLDPPTLSDTLVCAGLGQRPGLAAWTLPSLTYLDNSYFRNILWRSEIDGLEHDTLSSGAICSGDLVYGAVNGGFLFSLDSASGSLVWATQLEGEFFGTPIVANDYILVSHNYPVFEDEEHFENEERPVRIVAFSDR